MHFFFFFFCVRLQRCCFCYFKAQNLKAEKHHKVLDWTECSGLGKKMDDKCENHISDFELTTKAPYRGEFRLQILEISGNFGEKSVNFQKIPEFFGNC